MRISAHSSSKEMSGDFVGHATSLGLGFPLCLVENSLFCVNSFSFMLFCKLEKKILRNGNALK